MPANLENHSISHYLRINSLKIHYFISELRYTMGLIEHLNYINLKRLCKEKTCVLKMRKKNAQVSLNVNEQTKIINVK
jgi:hypothetical protein